MLSARLAVGRLALRANSRTSDFNRLPNGNIAYKTRSLGAAEIELKKRTLHKLDSGTDERKNV